MSKPRSAPMLAITATAVIIVLYTIVSLLLLPDTRAANVAADSLIASYPLEGIAVDPDANRVWMTSVSGGVVSVVQDGEPVCLLPFSSLENNDDSFQFEVFVAGSKASARSTRDRLIPKRVQIGR
jgi:DNA-binding beta-propeller fold protein YncE